MTRADTHTRRIAPLAATAAAILLLAGCEPAGPDVIVYDPLPPLPPAQPQGILPEGQPVVPRVELDLEDGLPSPAVANCMSAVSQRAGNMNVAVVEDRPSGDGREITVAVGEDRTRWTCTAGPAGEIEDVAEAAL